MKWNYNLSDIDIQDDEIKNVLEVVRSKWLSTGPVTDQFEKKISEFLGVEHVSAVCNCTAALHLALRVLGITEGDEIIVPSLSFVASANCIAYVGARPVFADVSSTENLTISPEDISRKITRKTKAILVMHYGGYPCDMKRILRIARENDLYVIEDAAHAIGGTVNGNKLGTIGDVGCFSFFANKNLVTGEGGMIVSHQSDLIKKAKLMRSHGMTAVSWDKERGHASSYDVTDLGYNYRITEMQSAMGLAQLDKLKCNNEKRRELVERYQKNLAHFEIISIPFSNYKGSFSFHIFPILLDRRIDRNVFRQQLKKRGIQTSIHYPPIHLFSYYRVRFGCYQGMLPVTEDIARRTVTLPLHPLLTKKDIDKICNHVDKILKSGNRLNF